MTTAKAIAYEYMKRVWGEKDVSGIDALMYSDVVIHSLLGDFHGHAAMHRVVEAWLLAFPNLHVKNLFSLCENDLVSIVWQANGTHQGVFKHLEPTGKPVSYSGVSIYRVQNSKIYEYWAFLDMQHILNQLA